MPTNAELYERAKRVIPSACQTYSKGADRFGRPIFVDRANGPWVWDVEGKRYIDFVAALGPTILGHGDMDAQSAITSELSRCNDSLSCPSELEILLAEELCDVLPGAEQIRFCKNGADATAAAVRLARAFTGEDYVISSGYHGYQDWYMAKDPKNWKWTNPGGLYTLDWDRDVAKLQKLLDGFSVCAVIIEPLCSQEPEFDRPLLHLLRDMCNANKSLLIFDEVFTFGRFPGLTAAEYFGVTPDLICVSKALANGMPLAAVAGKREIMQQLDDGVFFSTTFAGETLSLAAGLATVRKLRQDNVPEFLWQQGAKLQRGLVGLAVKHGCSVEISEWDAHFWLRWANEEQGRAFQQAALDGGVLIAYPTYFNLMASHTDDVIDETLAVLDKAMEAASAVSV